MNKYFVLPALLMLAACNDPIDIDTVKARPVGADTTMTVGEVLDNRPVCSSTAWHFTEIAKEQAVVEYECVFSLAQVQPVFADQMRTWVERNTRRVADGERMLAEAEKAEAQASDTLSAAHKVFEQLQASGDLPRYKQVVAGSAVDNMSLEDVYTHVSEHELFKKDKAGRAAIEAVYRVVTAAGLTPSTPEGDACQTPAALMLTIGATESDVEKAFDQCQESTAKVFADKVSAINKKRNEAQVRLTRLGGGLEVSQFKETFRWSLVRKEKPVISYHGLELVTNDEAEPGIVRTLGTTDEDLAFAYEGKLESYYHNMLISMMSDIVRR